MPIRKLDNWNSERFRLTTFPVVGQKINPQEIFEFVVGVPPEDIHITRELGQTLVSGGFGSGNVQLVTQPDRIHWIYTPSEKSSRDERSIPVLGPYPEIVDTFHSLADRWLGCETCPEITRIAFGSVLLSQIESQQVGYEWLTRYVPSLVFDPQRVSDVLYQINRWRKDDNSGLKVNRLAKWSVALLQITGLQFNPKGIRQISGEQMFALRLELDISTDQAHEDAFQKDSIHEIFDKLVLLGKEIAEEGDIP